MKYRKRPIVIEAVQWTGDQQNWEVVSLFINAPEGGAAVRGTMDIIIHTLEGDMRAGVGDWIIRGVAGELYPCKPEIFAATYEPVFDVG